jgi:hypothetical protein
MYGTKQNLIFEQILFYTILIKKKSYFNILDNFHIPFVHLKNNFKIKYNIIAKIILFNSLFLSRSNSL